MFLFLLNMTKPTDSVSTPQYILTALTSEFGQLFDPCPLNPTFDPTVDVDGLTVPWGKTTFVNPPYSNAKPWVLKAVAEHKLGKTVILLLKVDILPTAYFQQCADAVELRFFNHRIQFPGFERKARFASMLVVFKNKTNSFKMVDYRTD